MICVAVASRCGVSRQAPKCRVCGRARGHVIKPEVHPFPSTRRDLPFFCTGRISPACVPACIMTAPMLGQFHRHLTSRARMCCCCCMCRAHVRPGGGKGKAHHGRHFRRQRHGRHKSPHHERLRQHVHAEAGTPHAKKPSHGLTRGGTDTLTPDGTPSPSPRHGSRVPALCLLYCTDRTHGSGW